MKTFKFNVEATRKYYADVEIEANSQDEANKEMRDYLSEIDAGGGEDENWLIDDSNYSCQELDDIDQEIEAQNESFAEATIHIFTSSDGNWMYDIYAGSPIPVGSIMDNGEDNESLDGGCCTGRFCDALDMASDQANSQYLAGNL